MARPLKYPQLANLKMVGDVVDIEATSELVPDVRARVRRYAKRKGFDVRIDHVFGASDKMDRWTAYVRVERRS
jgi:hypothetical protein